MKRIGTTLPGVWILEPTVYEDPRGYFMETYHRARYQDMGIGPNFVQDNLSFSVQGTLRGLHYQHPRGQAKLVQVIEGAVYDVAVDIRRGSPSFGRWVAVELSAENRRQVFIPQGFAHGFCVRTGQAVVTYKCSDFYDPACERGILWSDPRLAIPWPVQDPILSDKDRRYPCLAEVPPTHLPG